LAEFTPLSGKRSVLPIVERRTIDDIEWLRVMLPGRPNNRTGWIHADVARITKLSWRIRVDLSNRALVVFKEGHLARRIRVVVGAAITPSPQGRFFVMERVRLGTSWSKRGWALALSGFSNILRHYDGGQGQVAIHARGSLEGALGTAASHGCIRVADREAGWLAARIPRGTVVEIVK
jgi:lipoprotein-anchoring transpeptidase ErfK/SrfK